jgi:hypothetical protein
MQRIGEHFARAFRVSTGTTPYQWLTKRRRATRAHLRVGGLEFSHHLPQQSQVFGASLCNFSLGSVYGEAVGGLVSDDGRVNAGEHFWYSADDECAAVWQSVFANSEFDTLLPHGAAGTAVVHFFPSVICDEFHEAALLQSNGCIPRVAPRRVRGALLMAQPVIDGAGCIEKRAQIVVEWLFVTGYLALLLVHLAEKKLCLFYFLVYSRNVHRHVLPTPPNLGAMPAPIKIPATSASDATAAERCPTGARDMKKYLIEMTYAGTTC